MTKTFQREINAELENILSPLDIKRFKRYLAQDGDLYFEEINENQRQVEPKIIAQYMAVISGRVIDVYRILESRPLLEL